MALYMSASAAEAALQGLIDSRAKALHDSRELAESVAAGHTADNGETNASYLRMQQEVDRLGELISTSRRDLIDIRQDEARSAEFTGAMGRTGFSPRNASVTMSWSARAADAIVTAQEERALNSGSIDIKATIERLAIKPAVPTRVFDLLTHVTAEAGLNSTSYLRQIVRTNNAAFVPDSGLKPTSVFTLQEIEDRLRVVAHLSEPYPLRYMSDRQTLARFIESELEAGVLAKLDNVILNGTNVGEEFTGLISLASTAVAFDTSAVKTMGAVLVAQQDVGEVPNCYIMRASDFQTMALERASTGGPYLNGNPVDSDKKTVHGLPVIFSPNMPAGFSLLGDFNQADVLSKDSTISWDGSGAALFDYNLTKARAEIRVVLRTYRPSSFKYIDISA